MTRIFKKRSKVKKNYALPEEDSEFTPTRSKGEQTKVTETLAEIDHTLSMLNKHHW